MSRHQKAPSYFSKKDKDHFVQIEELDAKLQSASPGTMLYCRGGFDPGTRRTIVGNFVFADHSVGSYTFPARAQQKLSNKLANGEINLEDYIVEEMLKEFLKDISGSDFKHFVFENEGEDKICL